LEEVHSLESDQAVSRGYQLSLIPLSGQEASHLDQAYRRLSDALRYLALVGVDEGAVVEHLRREIATIFSSSRE